MQGLKRFADNYFDLAIVDPPYGIGADKAQNTAEGKRWQRITKQVNEL